MEGIEILSYIQAIPNNLIGRHMQMYSITPPIVLLYTVMKDSCDQITNLPAVLLLVACEVCLEV